MTPIGRWVALGFSVALAAAPPAACSGPSRARESAMDREEPPADFSLGVAVVAPEAAPLPGGAAPPRSRRPARYILEADGMLRASFGSGSAVTTFPPETRQLTRRQVRELWLLVRDAGFLMDAGDGAGRSPSRIASLETTTVRPGRATALLDIGALGDRGAYRVNLEGESAESRASEELVDALARLAWVEE